MKKRTSLRTKEVFSENGEVVGNIEFTDEEVKALRAYIGEDVGYSFYPENDMLYSITNAIFKAGRTLGETSANTQLTETNASLRFNTSEFGVLPILYQADKDLKDNISIQDIQKYPLLQLICNKNGTLKTYEEIVNDRENYKLEHAEEQSEKGS